MLMYGVVLSAHKELSQKTNLGVHTVTTTTTTVVVRATKYDAWEQRQFQHKDITYNNPLQGPFIKRSTRKVETLRNSRVRTYF